MQQKKGCGAAYTGWPPFATTDPEWWQPPLLCLGRRANVANVSRWKPSIVLLHPSVRTAGYWAGNCSQQFVWLSACVSLRSVIKNRRPLIRKKLCLSNGLGLEPFAGSENGNAGDRPTHTHTDAVGLKQIMIDRGNCCIRAYLLLFLTSCFCFCVPCKVV